MILRDYDRSGNASMRKDWSDITRRWLGHLSFAFLVVAFFLGWEGYKRYMVEGGQIGDWRTLLDFVAAGMSLVLAFTGLRERHRRRL